MLDGPSRAICWAPDGSYIAVGLGGGSGDEGMKDGTLQALDALTLQVLFEARDASTRVTDICFTPLGDTCAMGVAEGIVLVYDTDINGAAGDEGPPLCSHFSSSPRSPAYCGMQPSCTLISCFWALSLMSCFPRPRLYAALPHPPELSRASPGP